MIVITADSRSALPPKYARNRSHRAKDGAWPHRARLGATLTKNGLPFAIAHARVCLFPLRMFARKNAAPALSCARCSCCEAWYTTALHASQANLRQRTPGLRADTQASARTRANDRRNRAGTVSAGVCGMGLARRTLQARPGLAYLAAKTKWWHLRQPPDVRV